MFGAVMGMEFTVGKKLSVSFHALTTFWHPFGMYRAGSEMQVNPVDSYTTPMEGPQLPPWFRYTFFTTIAGGAILWLGIILVGGVL